MIEVYAFMWNETDGQIICKLNLSNLPEAIRGDVIEMFAKNIEIYIEKRLVNPALEEEKKIGFRYVVPDMEATQVEIEEDPNVESF